MINKWLSKWSRDVAGNFKIHRNQGDITAKRNEQKILITSKPEISREIHLEFSKQESTGSCTFFAVDLSVNPLTKINKLYNQMKVPIPRSLVPIFKKAIIVHRKISVSNGSY